ncbi:glycoside hydrolase/phage tail family protein [Thalassococcus sp. CAU 1522]|uniref:Glycoside hydrolase/phage tail family protein n=1 Tax=Thalassococcus arenae TaxID=2851652 RepID=A0ABS6NBB3_9RHOB|nr:glycoside hydrolase/phage tail family protein [Thalassococcus arenae]MBV2361319.1 glycoside hydrolase/phage tail family protein [Thalassococcus arenae]
MATILLSAAGAAIGSSVGGSVLGLSMTAVGRFIGASLGRAIDQRLMGSGAEAVETGRIERFRLTGAGEGAPIAQVYGRMRVGGHVIWSTEFREHVKKKRGGGGGGKGAPEQPTVKTYSYSISLAVALCEGEIAGVTRVWADGVELSSDDLTMRVYLGTRDQQPDPKMEAVEGAGTVPAYRGTAYVVFEDLQLDRFGNRVPQFSFEVLRPDLTDQTDVPLAVKGVALMPGSGEYTLATQRVTLRDGRTLFGQVGAKKVANINTPSERPDFEVAMDALQTDLPNCEAASLVVSWFGDDLRCGSCTIRPKVEQTSRDSGRMPWRVAGLTRDTAQSVPMLGDGAVYGGTPTDQSVIQAIRHMNDRGLAVVYYPFILMDQLDGNTLPDPWTGKDGQPALPWRGRITLDAAPGRAGSTDGTAAAEVDVAAFFGTAEAADFTIGADSVSYQGPAEWRYRRFILHQAALCAAAGGVDAFCIGSEMRSLTQIRGASGFPAVEALRALAAECRTILGPDVKIGYAADWSEYFGYHPQDGSGDVLFHLDPLWADPQIDFIGIDNYMPLSDWRDGANHADAEWSSVYNLDYLAANVAGGEGYDWYYPGDEARDLQLREPITDGAFDEPWVWRYKDIRGWWENRHHNRIGGLRSETPTEWVPGSKPIWFTEMGCAAIDKGTNQPNKFLDEKSSESALPYFSSGQRDELIQRQYLRAMYGFWTDPANNPVSEVYDGPMVDMSRALVWAWDTRPYPWFPGNSELWTDSPNYRRGHWLTGRATGRTLASVVCEICARVGLTEIDTSGLHGFVRGFLVPDVADARHALQPLMLAYGFDAIERDGRLVFRMRDGAKRGVVNAEHLALSDEIDGDQIETRSAEAEMAGRVRVQFVEADGDHGIAAEEAVMPEDRTHAVAESDLALALTRAEGRQTAERWLAEARVVRDTFRLSLPLSRLDVAAGDLVSLPAKSGPILARIDRVELGAQQLIEAVRVEPDVYKPAEIEDFPPRMTGFTAAVPVSPVFLDLPLMTGDEVPHAPHLALTADPWPGSVAVYTSPDDSDYALDTIIAAQSVIGVTETPLFAASSGVFDNGAPLQVRLASGSLQSVGTQRLLSGANVLAIGDGSPGNWELLQFANAEPLGADTWLLGRRLRGQLGTDAVMPDVWPEGSIVVLMDGTPAQIALSASERRLNRHFRIGPSRRFYDDDTYVHEQHAFDGVGLRPYSPAHLRLRDDGGDFVVSWIRRTRIDGDGWEGYDVPLGEDREIYLVRVMQGDTVRREVQVSEPVWTYSQALRASDGLVPGARILVAQMSDRFGPGPFAELACPV